MIRPQKFFRAIILAATIAAWVSYSYVKPVAVRPLEAPSESVARPALSVDVPMAPLASRDNKKNISKATSGLRLFPELAPLNDSESVIFEQKILKNVRRMLDWGNLPEEQFSEFRKALAALADRGAAQEARKLNDLHKGDTAISSEQSAAAIVAIDTLLFLARRNHPVSKKALFLLASRDVPLTARGDIADPVSSTVTFEAFQGLAAVDPAESQALIRTKSSKEQAAFVYHHIVGRKLRGIEQDKAISEAKSAFGKELVASIGF